MTSFDLDLTKYQLGWSDEVEYAFKPEKGLNPDVVDQILKINDKIAHYHGLTGGLFGGSDGDGDDGDDEARILLRIKASAPVLRPDGPMPPNPIL